MRVVACVAVAVALAGGTAAAQSPASPPVDAAKATPAPPVDADEPDWSFSASAYTYVVPDDRDYVQPTVTADRGWLHLEARFNYEDLDTGSAWFGYNVSVGDAVTLEIAPIVGVVFGNTTGIAPGYKGTLAWRALELSSETEYVFDTAASDDSFLYTWSELALAPADWWRVGLVVQRTKVYETEFDVQRGFLAGFSYKRLDVTAYLFDPDASRPTGVVGVVATF
jgi:hypothetical protein